MRALYLRAYGNDLLVWMAVSESPARLSSFVHKEFILDGSLDALPPHKIADETQVAIYCLSAHILSFAHFGFWVLILFLHILHVTTPICWL
jgi:hypothetical protein